MSSHSHGTENCLKLWNSGSNNLAEKILHTCIKTSLMRIQTKFMLYNSYAYRKIDKHGYPISFIYSHETKVIIWDFEKIREFFGMLHISTRKKNRISQFIECVSV